MVEVFKTNVRDREQADMLLEQLRKTFSSYAVNFDLEDCDRILRVQTVNEEIAHAVLIGFLGVMGCKAEVLEDTVPPLPKPRSSIRCTWFAAGHA